MAMMASAPVRTEDLTGQWASVPDRAAVGRAAASASPPRRLVDRLWYRFSVRAQLLLTFIAIGLVASLVAGAVTVLQARKSTRLEIAASLRMAEILVGETTELLQQELSADQFLINLPAQLRSVRHLRVTVRDMSGAPVSSDVADARTDGRAPPPAWFAALIAPPVVTREQPVVTKGERIGSVLLTGEASDEISEVWENTVDFALVSLLVGLVAIAALHLLLGRVLDPLTALYAGLVDLEQRNYRVRLTRPKALELAAITDRFNSLAHALDALRADNARLNRRLITAQDDERRHTALELHDEVGPSLFGLKANATSIANAVGQDSDRRLSGLRERAAEMLAIVDHLQSVNRSMLNRLRPMALGHVPLADLVSEIVRERARQHPDIAFRFSADTLPPSYGEPVDLTVYRCIQEGLTNAIRHAGATRIDAELCARDSDRNGAPWLELVVRDNGRGFAAATEMGRGLLGMQERVQALAGSCAIEGGAGQGALLRITIPVPPRSRDSVQSDG